VSGSVTKGNNAACFQTILGNLVCEVIAEAFLKLFDVQAKCKATGNVPVIFRLYTSSLLQLWNSTQDTNKKIDSLMQSV